MAANEFDYIDITKTTNTSSAFLYFLLSSTINICLINDFYAELINAASLKYPTDPVKSNNWMIFN